MKRKRLAALGLSLALTLSLSVVPAHALDFSDVPEDFWGGAGYEYIHRMYAQGLAKGYEDGTFKPNGKMTAAETLLFCARATGVDAATQKKIAEDRKEQMTQVLPESNNMNVWAADEMALAVETGVLSVAELTALSQVDPRSASSAPRTYLEETMSRENIAMYLVRAMQLEPLARSLSAYTLTYPDASNISSALRPYVYILTQYGIVNGKGTGEAPPIFDPQGSVTRAEMTTMLCRALDFMKDTGIATELSEYTDYDWTSGTISAVATAADGSTIITLTSPLTETPQSYSLPTGVKIYDDNMLTTASALKNGQYARLNLTRRGAVDTVRVSGVLTKYEGSVSELEDGQLALLTAGQTRSLTIDRFTSVAVGQSVGGRALIDYDAGYTTATAFVDEMGHLAAVRFSGGTQLIEGLVESVTVTGGVTNLGVAAYNGVVSHFTIPEGIIVTVNGMPNALAVSHVGKAVRVRVSVDSGAVTTVAVDSVSSYVQGPIRRLGRIGTAQTVILADRFTGKEVTYPISPSAVITYNGESRTVSQIETGWYATAVVFNELYTQLDAYPGSVVLEGVLTSIGYGTTTVLQVTQTDGSVLSCDLDITNLPPITRGGKTATIDQLRTGDTVVLTLRYNRLEKLDATAQSANLTGVIDSVTQDASGVTIGVTLSDGTAASYTVGEGVTVTQGAAASNVYNLRRGYAVALVTDGSRVISIEITSVAAASSTRLIGTVLLVSTAGNNRTMTVQVTDATGATSLVTMEVRNAQLLNVNGSSLSLSTGFAAGDTVEAYGSYNGAAFVATIVIKQ